MVAAVDVPLHQKLYSPYGSCKRVGQTVDPLRLLDQADIVKFDVEPGDIGGVVIAVDDEPVFDIF